jgi:hypothetical protein
MSDIEIDSLEAPSAAKHTLSPLLVHYHEANIVWMQLLSKMYFNYTDWGPCQRLCAFLSVSVNGDIYLVSNKGRSASCDCMPCSVRNTKETFTSYL